MTAVHRAVFALLVLSMLVVPRPAAAGPNWIEADARFKHGVQLFKENDFAGALIEFRRAYEIDPKYQVLYNIGESYYQLQDYANALKTLQRYLSEGGRNIAPARRKTVEGEIATLSKRVATLAITTSEQGANVAVDDVPVGTTPMGPLTVSAGRRRVTATLAGRVPVTQLVDLAGGDQQAIRLEIPPLGATIQPPKPPPKPPPSILPTVFAWSATGTVATAAVITGVLALGASSDLKAELEKFPGDPDALSSAKDKAFGFGLATDILIGTSLAAAAVSVYLTIDFAIDSDAAETPPAPVRPAVRMTMLPGGLSFSGAF